MALAKFDRNILKQVRTSIEEALAPLAEQLGITVSLGSISFFHDEFNVRLTAKLGNNPEEQSKKEWNKYCYRIGLNQDDFGKEFVMNGETFKISGIKPKSHKLPLIITSLKSGKQYKSAVSSYKAKSGNNTELSAKDKKKFEEMASALSPENLCCDGELSRTQTQQRHRQIMREWRALETKVGRTVTEYEVTKWWMDKIKK